MAHPRVVFAASHRLSELWQEFIISQGSSTNIAKQTWDKLWTLNKRVIDPVVPRYTAIAKEGIVTVHVTDGPPSVICEPRPKHPKNPAVGEKSTRFLNRCLIEKADAETVRLFCAFATRNYP
eukprot:SAG31_NODE_1781_length_7282_cov_1.770291_4_plen_122_part_00